MKNYQGFTLVEVMVASSLVMISAVFLTNIFLEKSEERLVNSYVSDFMTLGNASRAYVQNTDGRWPGEFEVDDYEGGDKAPSLSCSGGFSELETNDYIGGIVNDYTFSCLQVKGRMPVLKIERDFSRKPESLAKDLELAEWIASLLPSGSATSTKVAMYIPKPRVAQIVDVGSVVWEELAPPSKNIQKPSCRRPKLSTMIKAACVKNVAGENACTEGVKSLGGYRVNVEDIEVGGVSNWRASLEVSYGSQPTVFDASYSCEDAAFDYIVYCE